MKKKIKLIVIGGNRLNEINPFYSLLELKKKYDFDLEILTEKTHLNKSINKQFKNFKSFLNSNKINYKIIRNYSQLLFKLKNIKFRKNIYILLLNSIFLLKKDIINMFKYRIFNLHIGKLPLQRGAGTTTWQFMSEIKSSAVTIHRVDKEVDNGNIIIENKFKCNHFNKPIDYYKFASKLEKKTLEQFLRKIIYKQKFNEKKQKTNLSIYMPRLDTLIHSYINWNWSKEDIKKFITSFDQPFKGAQTFLNKNKCVITDCSLIKSSINFHPFQSGLIIRKKDKYIYIAVKNGIIKAKINFNSHSKIKSLVGKRLHTPIKYLERALETSVLHKPNSIAKKF